MSERATRLRERTMQACGNVFRPFYGAKLSPRRLKYKLRRKEQRESRWKRPFFEKAAAPLIGDSGQRCDNK